MKTILTAATAVLVLSVLLAVSGCSSNSTPSAIDQVLEPRVEEYVGDGGGSLKPWPDFLGPLGHDSPSVVAPKLRLFSHPKTGKVARKQVSWYRFQAIPSSSDGLQVVVTLQPTASDHDTDLFVLEGKAKEFDDGAQTVAYSRRAPSAGDSVTGGGAPDWVGVEVSSSGGWPGAHIAVLGANNDPAVKHFRLEADQVIIRIPGEPALTGSVVQHDSHWYGIMANTGTHYTVLMDDTGAGDPDVFVYGSDATKFIAKNTTTGDASIGFTAAETAIHYIRIYGYSSNPNDYSIEVTGP